MSKTRLLVMSRGFRCERVFGDLFDSVFQHGEGRNIFGLHFTPDDTFLFEGGTDISPRLYDQSPATRTQHADRVRDAQEEAVFLRAKKVGASFIGICRGAQLLTALAGGELIQDVSGHAGSNHFITVRSMENAPKDIPGSLITNSLHHQMMFPFGLPEEEYVLEGWCETPRSTHYTIEGDIDLKGKLPTKFVEPEIVWYKNLKALAIQGHPEFAGREVQLKPFVNHCRYLTKERILNV